jgi:hypothetical protein
MLPNIIPSADTPCPSESSQPIVCKRCGAIDVPVVSKGTGPHAFKAICAHCGAFLKWFSRYTPEQQKARRNAFFAAQKEANNA